MYESILILNGYIIKLFKPNFYIKMVTALYHSLT